ncbi:Ku protein [Kitasatospora sp. NPDC051914]|uniref:non-homologous end joining protein Ku n=1 Tax=Kitasatospora sp. NPDC051914 TaxID=3154945 RepID=UPI003448B94F
MTRSTWSGTLTFGLVSLPVSLYASTQQGRQHFHELERATGARIRYRRVSSATGEPVPYEEIVKGVQLPDGTGRQYVTIEPAELEQSLPEPSKTIEVAGFVPLDRIDPVHYDRSYYMGPRSAEHGRIYELLHQALGQSGRVAIARFTMRGRLHLAVVRARPDVLVVHTLHYAAELRDPLTTVDHLPQGVELSQQELAVAEEFLTLTETDWQPEQYRDPYEEAVKGLVGAKAARGEIVTAPEPMPVAEMDAADLIELLERSIAEARTET